MKKMFSQLLGWLSNTTKAIMACLPQIVEEVEEAAKSGKITSAQQKQIAMDSVNAIATKMGIKLNWLSKLAISWSIDEICKKFPPKDISVPSVVANAINQKAV